ncbi:MAG: pseudouridine synthase family protein [Bacteroidota bacterium]|jgi:23S rRNA pseudouridine2605 synthase|nr:pseudouridine synthase family protein [Bacteroidota bacterium]
MSRDSQGPRRTFSKGGSSDFNKRKSFSSSEKPKRTYKSSGNEGSSYKKKDGDSAEKRSYSKKESSESRPRKTYGGSEKSGEKRTYGKRLDGSFRSKSSSGYGSDEKRSYTKRENSDDKPRRRSGDSEGKAFVKRADGKYESASPRKSYDDGEKRSYTKRDSSEERPRRSSGDGERKPFVKREDGKYESAGPRKTYGEGEKRSYTKRDSSEERPRRSSEDGERKPFVKREDGKYESAGPRKSYGDGEKRSYTKRDSSEERPRRSSGDGERKPFVKREDGKYEGSGPRKSYDDKEKRSYSKKEDSGKSKKSFERRDFDKPYEPKLSKSEKIVEKSKKAGPSKTSDQQNVSDDAIRLNRYVANAGICSRREADVLIATGVVTVNGKIVTEMGYKVNPTDVVTYGGVPIKNEVKKYLILNKPKDYITTMDDPEERKTVMELVRKACKERLYPVGRLDRNTTGLLLFTNDGDLTAKLTHPKFEVRKVYHVTLDKKMTTEDYRTLCEGVELADGFIKPDAVEFVGAGKFELGVEIHSGKNRIVRRMFEHLGYEVIKLDRVAFAGITKKDLPRAKYRFLTEKEIAFLKMLG